MYWFYVQVKTLQQGLNAFAAEVNEVPEMVALKEAVDKAMVVLTEGVEAHYGKR